MYSLHDSVPLPHSQSQLVNGIYPHMSSVNAADWLWKDLDPGIHSQMQLTDFSPGKGAPTSTVKYCDVYKTQCKCRVLVF